MIPPDEEELLNREIDGEVTPEQARTLEDLLAARPEVRARHEELQELAQVLGRVGLVEPPPGLTGEVMGRIRAKERPEPRRRGWLEGVRALPRPALFRYALACAAGLVLGSFLTTFLVGPLLRPELEGSQLSATMWSADRVGAVEDVDRVEFHADGLRGEAATRLGEALVLAEIRIEARKAVEVEVDFDHDVLSPIGVERSGGDPGSEVVVSPDRVRLAHAGNGSYLVAFGVSKRVPSQLRLDFKGEGIGFEKRLETRP